MITRSGRHLAIFDTAPEPLLSVRQKRDDRMAFCVFELHSHCVRVGQTDIGYDGGSSQGVTSGSESIDENLDHGVTGRVLASPWIAGDEPSLAGGAERGGEWEELSAGVQHLLRKRERRPKEGIEVVLRLLGC